MATRTALRRTAEQTAAACIEAKAVFLAKRDELRAASDAYNLALLDHTKACEALTAAFPNAEAPSGPPPELTPPPARAPVTLSASPVERRGLFSWFRR